MDSPAERLRKAREIAGYETAAAAARALNIKEPTYYGHENGSRGLRRDEAIRYSRFFRVDLDWLLTGRGDPKHGAPSFTPVVGYVGAGEEIIPIDDHAKGAGLDELPIIQGLEDAVAVVVRGDSMKPVYRPGDALYYRRDGGEQLSALIGRECIVALRDGRMFVKVLRRGAIKGRYSLQSYNADLMEDQDVDWAAPVEFIRRAR